jgi:diguanylate cyclase (GGDEF)-like protein/PAS domain S-box-containing protein
MKYHKLIQEQIDSHIPELSEDPRVKAFLDAVHHSYTEADEQRQTLERSVKLSAKQLISRNKELEQQVTELKITQSALKESHSLLHASLESSHEALLVFDLEGKIRLYNPNFSEMFEIDPEEQSINHIDDFLRETSHFFPSQHSFELELKKSLQQPEKQVICEVKTLKERTIEAYSNPQRKGRSDEIIGLVWSFRDISELKLKEEEAKHRAYHDLLTGLPNRRLLSSRLDSALHTAEQSNDQTIVLFIDLDGFKDVNDSLGHGVGDALLKAITIRLEAEMPANTLLSRHGGDEFIAVMEKQAGTDNAMKFAEAIVTSFGTPFHLGNEDIYMSASIGIACAPEHGNDSEKLISNADLAMYQAKKRGKNTYVVYQPSDGDQPAHRLKIRSQLNVALEQEQFELFFQPKIDLETGSIKGAEALIRWKQENGEYRSPFEFIPIAEENGQIIPISQWVIHRCCQHLKEWQPYLDTGFVLALNISARHFHRGLLQEDLARSLGTFGIDPSTLELEVTETAIMDDLDLAVQTLQELKRMGIRTAIDDFGTGHSSLSYLRKLPIEILKIDKSFVDEILVSQEDRTLVRGIIEMVHALGIQVVAEGVENHHMASLLQDMHCDLVQGYHYCPPISEADFLELIKNRQCYI